MILKSSIKPLELVISAIHCLKERKGSSPRHILKYLTGKYNVNTKALKILVEAGLKRGLSFGLITQKSGLYRLNDILSAPSNVPKIKFEKKQKDRIARTNKTVKKKKLKKRITKGKKKLDKNVTCVLLKHKKKSKKSKEKKHKQKKKPHGDHLRRNLNETKRRKSKRQKAKVEKTNKAKVEKVKKPTPEKETEASPPKTENIEAQRCSTSNKELKN